MLWCVSLCDWVQDPYQHAMYYHSVATTQRYFTIGELRAAEASISWQVAGLRVLQWSRCGHVDSSCTCCFDTACHPYLTKL